ncbi:MAG: cbb3-type cytochrome c oxidase subunit I, partial [Bacteroidota bacterium]
LTGIYLGNAALDINLHDTYFVVAHFHIVMGSASMFGMLAGVYHWYPKMYGRMMDEKLGYLHFWLTFASVYLVFFPMHFMGLDGVPRRYYQFTGFEFMTEWMDMNRFISVSAIMATAAQLIFFYNFFRSIRYGKVAPQNPWNANTLEWTTPVERLHGNWPGEIPHVHRWPYDYSRPGAPQDFILQTVPDEELPLAARGRPTNEALSGVVGTERANTPSAQPVASSSVFIARLLHRLGLRRA